MQEVWKDIPSFEGKYQVSNLGNIRSLNYHREKRIKNLKKRNRNGYLAVCLTNSLTKTQKSFNVHRLVLCAFESKPLDYPFQVNHIDGNKTNNILENLEFVTSSENVIHSLKSGLKIPFKGSQIHNSILNENDVIEIKKLLKDGHMMQKDIAILYGVHKATINDIHKEKNWKHITI